MKIGSKVVFKGGDGVWYEKVYTIKCITKCGNRVRFGQAIKGAMWTDISSVRKATRREVRLDRRSVII